MSAAGADETRVVETEHDYDAVANNPFVNGAHRKLAHSASDDSLICRVSPDWLCQIARRRRCIAERDVARQRGTEC